MVVRVIALAGCCPGVVSGCASDADCLDGGWVCEASNGRCEFPCASSDECAAQLTPAWRCFRSADDWFALGDGEVLGDDERGVCDEATLERPLRLHVRRACAAGVITSPTRGASVAASAPSPPRRARARARRGARSRGAAPRAGARAGRSGAR